MSLKVYQLGFTSEEVGGGERAVSETQSEKLGLAVANPWSLDAVSLYNVGYAIEMLCNTVLY